MEGEKQKNRELQKKNVKPGLSANITFDEKAKVNSSLWGKRGREGKPLLPLRNYGECFHLGKSRDLPN